MPEMTPVRFRTNAVCPRSFDLARAVIWPSFAVLGMSFSALTIVGPSTPSESARFEYNETVEAARKAGAKVTPTDPTLIHQFRAECERARQSC